MGSLRQVDIEPGIALLRLDRPARRIALDAGRRIELVDAVEAVPVAPQNELLEVFQRKGAGLPQGPPPG